jgi:hypothetical protein
MIEEKIILCFASGYDALLTSKHREYLAAGLPVISTPMPD